LPARARDQLILVEKEMLKWEHDVYGNSWETTRSTREAYKRLVRQMAASRIYKISHLTPDDAKVFLLGGLNRSKTFRSRSAVLLRRLSELHQKGVIPDGLAFDPSTLDVGFGSSWTYDREAMNGRTKPLPDNLLLPALAASVLFVRRYRPLLVTALREVEQGKPFDIAPFCELANFPSVKQSGLGAILAYLQDACYIIIASTVVGRINEFLDLRRGCHHVETVAGERGNYIDLPWSKLQGSRPIENALAMNLTAEAIGALEDVIAAHPEARHSDFLFARLRKWLSLEVGSPLSYDAMQGGLRQFLRDIVHIRPEVARAVCSHQFRATTLLRLCGVQDGLVVAFREARHTSIAETCRYVTSDVARLGIPANMAQLTGEAA
jgi:hypothetical protein